MYEYKARVIKIVDGDTYDLLVDLGLKVFVKARVRLAGIDTPEIFHASSPQEKEHGQAAKMYCVHHLLGKDVIVRTLKDRKGKYGRWLAVIYLDGEDWAQKLAEEGFAKREVY